MAGSDQPTKFSMGHRSLCFQKELRIPGSVSPGFKVVAKDMLGFKDVVLWVIAITERAKIPIRLRARERTLNCEKTVS